MQHVANCILLLTANALGLTSYFVDEKQQRRALLETRQSLEVKLVIEEQSAEQVSLSDISGYMVKFGPSIKIRNFFSRTPTLREMENNKASLI